MSEPLNGTEQVAAAETDEQRVARVARTGLCESSGDIIALLRTAKPLSPEEAQAWVASAAGT